jgi:predicted nucleotidyltransferase component of viral defense system
MIPKAQIQAIAGALGLLPTTVEKDYVLSWVLWGLSHDSQTNQWVFKGGTCLKKCYFDTYRFSEDLDFTVPSGGLYSAEAIRAALIRVTGAVYRESGIEFPLNDLDVRESINKRNRLTFEVKMTYSGPINLSRESRQRVKFDLTQDEVIAGPVTPRDVFFGYGDQPASGMQVRCYSIEEILAEKTRAIYERAGSPRDVFDIVNISRNFRSAVNPVYARAYVEKKFAFKELPVPTVELIISRVDKEILRANWGHSLGYQLPKMPPVEAFLDDFPDALRWWMEKQAVPLLSPIESRSANEVVLPKNLFRGLGAGYRVDATSAALETIRYAAHNQLLVRFTYRGVERLLEPYSLRQPATGNILLYAHEIQRGGGAGGGTKSFHIAGIINPEIMQTPFRPRYLIEL